MLCLLNYYDMKSKYLLYTVIVIFCVIFRIRCLGSADSSTFPHLLVVNLEFGVWHFMELPYPLM